MKILICVILIFALLTTCGILVFNKINTLIKDFDPLTEKIEAAIKEENPDKLKEETKKAISSWEKTRFFLSFFINHEYIFEVDSGLSELLAFSDTFDEAEATLSLSNVRAGLDCIIETSSFSFQNII